jgi:hypothetical protein
MPTRLQPVQSRGRRSPPRFHVRFLKELPKSTGLRVVACQASFMIEAATQGLAVEEAKQRLCAARRIRIGGSARTESKQFACSRILDRR